MIAAIFGFMPALDRRLSIEIRSGKAAKVVPNPAIKPRISDRVNVGASRLCVSVTSSPSQPDSMIVHRRGSSTRRVEMIMVTSRLRNNLAAHEERVPREEVREMRHPVLSDRVMCCSPTSTRQLRRARVGAIAA